MKHFMICTVSVRLYGGKLLLMLMMYFQIHCADKRAERPQTFGRT